MIRIISSFHLKSKQIVIIFYTVRTLSVDENKMSNFKVIIGVCVGLACLVGKSDGLVSLTNGATSTATIDNSAAATTAVTTVSATSDTTGLNFALGTPAPADAFFDVDLTSGAITVNAAGGTTSTGLDSKAEGATYTIVVDIVDDGGAAAVQHTVTVILNSSPVFNPATYTLTVKNGSPQATIVGTVTATDVDSDAITYSLTTGTNVAHFTIDGSTGVITVATGVTIAIADVSYTLGVDATAGGKTDTASVGITIVANNAPTFSPTTYQFTVKDAATAATSVGTVTASDSESDTITYSLPTGTDAAHFAIDGSSGVITVATGHTIDISHAAYALKAEATDGILTGTADVGITIVANSAPTFSPSTYQLTVMDEAAAATTVDTVTVTDSDSGDIHTFAIASGNTNTDFDINTSGKEVSVVVAATKTLDIDVTSSYVLKVSATDGTDSVTATLSITVNPNGAAVLVPMFMMMIFLLLNYV